MFLPTGWVVQFRQGASLFGQTVTLSVNFPEGDGQQFERSMYRPLRWLSDALAADDTALYAQLPLTMAGSFRYIFTVTGG